MADLFYRTGHMFVCEHMWERKKLHAGTQGLNCFNTVICM